MSDLFHCPECGEELAVPPSQCPCGWKCKKENKRKKTMNCYPCSYLMHEQECLSPGTMSNVIYGRGQWFCSYHFRLVMRGILNRK